MHTALRLHCADGTLSLPMQCHVTGPSRSNDPPHLWHAQARRSNRKKYLLFGRRATTCVVTRLSSALLHHKHWKSAAMCRSSTAAIHCHVQAQGVARRGARFANRPTSRCSSACCDDCDGTTFATVASASIHHTIRDTQDAHTFYVSILHKSVRRAESNTICLRLRSAQFPSCAPRWQL